MKKINLLQMAILFIPGVMGSAQAETLFECKLPDNKSATIAMQGAQLYYTFGKQNSEPDMQLNRDNDWYFYGQHGSGSNYQLSFRVVKGDYNYVIYSQDTGNGVNEGLVAYKGNKVLYNKHCTEPAKYDASLFQTDAADIGMNDESDQVSDYITSIASGNPPEANNDSQPQLSSQDQQPANGQPPIKVQLQDTASDYKGENKADHTVTRHIYVYSLVDSVTIQAISIDKGSCYKGDVKPFDIKYGKRYDFQVPYSYSVAYANAGWNWMTLNPKYNECMWESVEIKTNMGNYIFNLQ